MDYKEKYEQALERAKYYHDRDNIQFLENIFPELKESEDERIRKQTLKVLNYYKDEEKSEGRMPTEIEECIAWLEKQAEQKPNYCHHEVDLSDCSEEYCKAYYDGWNNCNMQHSQCRSELDDVVRCLINGMKFYYEDNEEATWGTDKWSMPVKHIIEVLERQGEKGANGKERKIPNSAWSEEDKRIIDNLISQLSNLFARKLIKEETKDKYVNWLKSLRPQNTWKPSERQKEALLWCVVHLGGADKQTLGELLEELNKL